MLITLAQMKSYLGVTGSTYDDFLTSQITLISDAIEAYCRRTFTQKTYEQTFYADDYTANKLLETFNFPLISVTSIFEDDVELDTDEYRFNKPTGFITRPCGVFHSYGTDKTVVTYLAGYADGEIPTPITSVVYDLVSERYNKKVSGIDLNFGSDVQRISIPGSISVDFDYSLSNNDRKITLGIILGSNVNILDLYRSERALIGSGKLIYVEET